MKRKPFYLLLCTIFCYSLLCGCSHEEEPEFSLSGELNQIPTPTTYSDEELAIQVSDFRDHVVTFYQEIQTLSADNTSYEKDRELVEAIEKQYGERIEELAATDFTELSRTELDSYMTELTSLTTKIREAKDALTLD